MAENAIVEAAKGTGAEEKSQLAGSEEASAKGDRRAREEGWAAETGE